MRIRNQSLLKRPWLFPICTVTGVFVGLFVEGTKGLSAPTIIFVLVGICIAPNIWFFVSLRQTQRQQAGSIPDDGAPNNKKFRYPLIGIGILALLWSAISYIAGEPQMALKMVFTAAISLTVAMLIKAKPKG